jgi:hypothetical protein
LNPKIIRTTPPATNAIPSALFINYLSSAAASGDQRHQK